MYQLVAGLSIFIASLLPLGVGAADVSRLVPEGLQLCQSYIRPYDVSAVVTAELREVAQGASVSFRGDLENRGETQLTTPTAYVRITDRSDTSSIVELIPATLTKVVGDIERYTFVAAWDVSAGVLPGQYEADAVVYTDGRNEVVGSLNPQISKTPYLFSVVPVGDAAGVSFDPTAVTINRRPVQFKDGSFVAPQDGPIEVGIRLNNSTNIPLKASVAWGVYAWDSPRAERLLQDGMSEVKIHSKSDGLATFTISDTEHAEYFIVSRLDNVSGNTAAFIHVVRDNAAEPQLIASGATEVAGTEGQVAYACVRSDFLPTDDVTLRISVNDSFLGYSWHIAQNVYTGSIPTNESYALSVPIGERSSGTVVSELYRNDVLIDSSETTFGPGHRGRDMGIVGGAVLLLIIAAVAIGRRRMVQ